MASAKPTTGDTMEPPAKVGQDRARGDGMDANDLKALHEATDLGDMRLEGNGREHVISPGELPVMVAYQSYPQAPLAARAAYFAALHNAYVTGKLVWADPPDPL